VCGWEITRIEAGNYRFLNADGITGDIYKCGEEGLWHIWSDKSRQIINSYQCKWQAVKYAKTIR